MSDYKKFLLLFLSLILVSSLFAKPKRELKILIDAEPTAEFELELWQEKPSDEDAVPKSTPEVIQIKGNKITVTPKDEFDYFRVRRIGDYGAKGYWTQVYSTNVDPGAPLAVPKVFAKPKPKDVVEVPQKQASVVANDSFINVTKADGKETIKYLTKNSLLIQPSDIGSGVSEVRYKINDGDWQSSKASTAVNFTEEISYVFRYFSVDQVGNKEPTQILFFTKDSTPPKTEIQWLGERSDSKQGKSSFVSLDTKIQLVALDASSGPKESFYAYACESGSQSEFLTYKSPIPIAEILSKCEKKGVKLFYYSVDQVGNEEPVKAIQFPASK